MRSHQGELCDPVVIYRGSDEFPGMQGVILAGGKGTRLRPMTSVMNKHILPVYNEPMIYYPVNCLIDSGIEDILIISSSEHIGKYIELLEAEFDANFTYRVQSEPAGIAHAVCLAESFVDDEFVVILGDNIVFNSLSFAIEKFESDDSDAMLFMKEVDEPSAYGVAQIEDDSVSGIIEKPDDPISNNAVLGMYIYTNDVFEKIRNITPSERGELEITDVNRMYIEESNVSHIFWEDQWFDAGTPEGLFKASRSAREQSRSE